MPAPGTPGCTSEPSGCLRLSHTRHNGARLDAPTPAHATSGVGCASLACHDLRLDVRSAARKQSEDVLVTVLLPSDIEAYGYPNDADPSPDLPAVNGHQPGPMQHSQSGPEDETLFLRFAVLIGLEQLRETETASNRIVLSMWGRSLMVLESVTPRFTSRCAPC